LHIAKDLLNANMRHVVVLRQLFCEVRFAGAWLARDKGFEWSETALLAELFLDELDVCGESTLAVPIEISLAVFTIAFTAVTTVSSLLNEKVAWCCLDVKHKEFSPIEIKLQGSVLWVHWSVLNRDIDRLNETGADALRNCLDELALRWLLSVVNTENVLALRLRLKDFLGHASQVCHVNRWHKVVSLTNDWQFLRILLP